MTGCVPAAAFDPPATALDPAAPVSTANASTDDSVTDRLAAEISGLSQLDLHALRVRWRRLMRQPAPDHLNRTILIRVIAYRMQAKVHGDLDADSIRALDRIARDHDRQCRNGQLKPKAVPDVAPVPAERGHGPGTMFLREHAGEMHRVTFTRDGYDWKGRTYRSLSEIAKAITGTTWSGPRFFGLRDPVADRSVQAAQLAQAAQSALTTSAVLARRGSRRVGHPTGPGTASGAGPGSSRSRSQRIEASDDRTDGVVQ